MAFRDAMAGVIPVHTQAAIFKMVKLAEDSAPTLEEGLITNALLATYRVPTIEGITREEVQVLLNMQPIELNTDTSLPLPTEEEWRMATDLDEELQQVKLALKDSE